MRSPIQIAIGGFLSLVMMQAASTSTSLLSQREPELAPMAHTIFCQGHPEDCEKKGGTAPAQLTVARKKELLKVNEVVNSTITSVDHPEGRRQPEQWRVGPARGDCNDYAVTKQHELLQKGWPTASVLLAEVILTKTGEHHLIVVVRTSEGDFVLDNLKREVLPLAEAKTKYRWRRVQSTENPLYWRAAQVEG
jgi:predicted transglutaminase-like cysteine proteinase